MSAAGDRSLQWLGYFPLAVDLANTVVVVTPGHEVDLLETERDLAVWIAADRDRFPVVKAAAGQLAEVRGLRDAVRDVLLGAAEDHPLPRVAIDAINRASARCPSYTALRRDGEAAVTELNGDAFDRFCAAVARSAIEVVSGEQRDQLAVCHAPSCGMFFIRGRTQQAWCSAPCGNRARVARHAARARAAG